MLSGVNTLRHMHILKEMRNFKWVFLEAVFKWVWPKRFIWVWADGRLCIFGDHPLVPAVFNVLSYSIDVSRVRNNAPSTHVMGPHHRTLQDSTTSTSLWRPPAAFPRSTLLLYEGRLWHPSSHWLSRSGPLPPWECWMVLDKTPHSHYPTHERKPSGTTEIYPPLRSRNVVGWISLLQAVECCIYLPRRSFLTYQSEVPVGEDHYHHRHPRRHAHASDSRQEPGPDSCATWPAMERLRLRDRRLHTSDVYNQVGCRLRRGVADSPR